jgi:hypothetical protein
MLLRRYALWKKNVNAVIVLWDRDWETPTNDATIIATPIANVK